MIGRLDGLGEAWLLRCMNADMDNIEEKHRWNADRI